MPNSLEKGQVFPTIGELLCAGGGRGRRAGTTTWPAWADRAGDPLIDCRELGDLGEIPWHPGKPSLSPGKYGP